MIVDDGIFDKRLEMARKSVAELDAIDGWADREPLTIMLALEGGLRNPDSNAAFDALVMLQDVVKKQGAKQ